MIEKKDIEKLATLARITITDGEAESLKTEIGAILGYVSELASIDVGAQDIPSKESLPLKNVLREDGEPHESGKYTEALLSQAPAREGNYLKVKKII